MGVDLRAVDVVNRLNQHGFIQNKSILTLGRQSVNVNIKLNGQTQSSAFKWLDELLLRFGASRAESMDVNAYEDASLIFDLQDEAPKSFLNRWDLILDFGTTEHIFDQKTVLTNIYNFLKPNGVYVAIIPRTNWNDHGLYQTSPEFYWTLGDVLPFDIECYTVSTDQVNASYFLYQNYGRDPDQILNFLREERTYNICFARKIGPDIVSGKLSTSPRYRTHFHRSGAAPAPDHANVDQMSISEFINRPLALPAPRIGIIHIATGPYKMFTQRFISSAVSGFEDGEEKIFYIITDDPNSFQGLGERYGCKIRYLKINHEPWPNPTLKRYEYISRLTDQFMADGLSHLFFVNSNSVFISANPVQELRKAGKSLGFVRHPGFIKNPAAATFETQENSLAFIKDLDAAREIYIQGFFYGGEAGNFLEMILELRDRVQKDLDNGVVAIWHDESHLNWARISRWRDQSLVFDAGYAFPEGWNINVPCRILSLDKSKRMNLSFKR